MRESRDTSLAMRSSCQTRALILFMHEGRVPGKSDIRVRLPAGNVLFPALLKKED
jgi:hypothetical protein